MKYAICNETFQNWEHERVCKFVAECGYTGLEIAPFTFSNSVTDIDSAQRQLIRKQAEDNGLEIIGTHWLLAQTEGLHLTSTDAVVRRKTAEYLVELARCTRDLGASLMVFGSPKQRTIPEGANKAQATDYALDTLRQTIDGIAETGVTFCLEPLAPTEADFIQTCEEGVAILDALDHPNFRLHQDVKAMSSESMPVPEVIRKYASRTHHFHANDPNMRGPGFGDTDFVPIFQALKETNYDGWVSVEVFDYSPDPETIARESLRYMRECEAKVS